jgi:hypothetical protein
MDKHLKYMKVMTLISIDKPFRHNLTIVSSTVMCHVTKYFNKTGSVSRDLTIKIKLQP